MAVHAPTHGKIFLLAYALHRLHGSVTFLAFHARGNVRSMIEIHEVRQLMNLHPLNRYQVFCGIELQGIVQCERGINFLNLRRD